MSGAPAFVSYAALVMSAGSLAVSFLAFRAGGPRLVLRATPARLAPDNPYPDGSAVYLSIVNTGRAAVTLEQVCITAGKSRKPAVAPAELHGPALPFRMEPHSMQGWYVDALPLAREYREKVKNGWVAEVPFRFMVVGGNAKGSHSKRTFDALRMVADAD